MRDLVPLLLDRQRAGRPTALATVVRTWSSAPRPVGSAMAITDDGEPIGSVSGGCVEGDLISVGRTVIADGVPRLVAYGVTDEDAAAVGLTCGGSIEVLVERIDARSWPELAALAACIDRGDPAVVAVVVPGKDPGVTATGRLLVRSADREGSLSDAPLEAHVVSDARELLGGGPPRVVPYDLRGEPDASAVHVLMIPLAPRARMLVFGASDFAADLVRIGTLLGFAVSVCDARATFVTRRRFPEADDVVVDWPHRWLERQAVSSTTVIAVLTHDPKFDIPVLEIALRSPAAYVGALGSRRTHADRVERLRAAGLTDAELDRLRSPIGLDLGAVTTAETALSIAAEIVQGIRGGSGRPLGEVTGPLHPRQPGAM